MRHFHLKFFGYDTASHGAGHITYDQNQVGGIGYSSFSKAIMMAAVCSAWYHRRN
jgi:hypothetical protein